LGATIKRIDRKVCCVELTVNLKWKKMVKKQEGEIFFIARKQ
jgi:hypothetical protein